MTIQAFLLTGFLGKPNTCHTKLDCPSQRLSISIDSVISLSKQLPHNKIYVAITGDRKGYQDFRQYFSSNPCHADIQFCFFQQDPADELFGKGRCEYKLITKAINEFDLSRYEQIVKITLKYFIQHIATALKTLESNSTKGIFGWKFYLQAAIDTRFFSFTPEIFARYEYVFMQVHDAKGFYFEHAAWKVARIENIRPLVFYNKPIIQGLSGSSNVLIKYSWRKRLLKSILRFIPF